MPDEMVVFENETFGQIRTVRMEDGETWFVAADVCRALELKNVSDSLRKLDDDEKMTLTSSEGHSGKRGGAQFMNIINEPGLYTLVLGSRKPEAKAFKRWITHEVLPEIRKTGGYSMKVKELTEQIDRVQSSIDRLHRFLEQQDNELLGLYKRLDDADGRKCLPAPRCDGLMTLYEVAEHLSMFPSELNKFLVSMGLLYWNKRGQLVPVSERNVGLFAVRRRYVPESDFYGWTTTVTRKGVETIRMLLAGYSGS